MCIHSFEIFKHVSLHYEIFITDISRNNEKLPQVIFTFFSITSILFHNFKHLIIVRFTSIN